MSGTIRNLARRQICHTRAYATFACDHSVVVAKNSGRVNEGEFCLQAAPISVRLVGGQF